MLINLGFAVKNYPSILLNISGYTDSAGPEQYNNRLSLIRASMVKSYLLGLGISPGRMTVQGLGSQKPIADNTTEQGRRLNRRVEIEVVHPAPHVSAPETKSLRPEIDTTDVHPVFHSP